MLKICTKTFVEEDFCNKCEKYTPHEAIYYCDKNGDKLEQYEWKLKKCICGHIRKNKFWNMMTRSELMEENKIDLTIEF